MSCASGDQHHHEIFENTRGIMFMGTPHRGSLFAELAQIPASLLGLFKSSNKALLAVLGTSSELLEDIHNEFFRMVQDRSHGDTKIRIQCFFEEIPTVRNKLVVPKPSATIDGNTPISIHANHRNMVRFVSDADTGFVRVWNVLAEWIKVPVMDRSTIEAERLRGQSSFFFVSMHTLSGKWTDR